MRTLRIDTGAYGSGYTAEPDEYGDFVYADEAQAEIEKWKRVAMAAAEGCWGIARNGTQLVNEDYSVCIPIDGTREGKLAALARAAGEEK